MVDLYIVSIKEGYKAEEVAKEVEKLGFEVVRVLKAINVLFVKAPEDKSIEPLKSLEPIRSVNENRKIQLR